MKSYYVAAGEVRGCCEHRHRSLTTAVRCAEKDREAIRQMPGRCYSDRKAHAHDCAAVRNVFTVACDCADESEEG